MFVELLSNYLQGYELGEAIGSLFDSPHVDDYNHGIDALQSIDFDNPNESQLYTAVTFFSSVDDDDKLYVRCLAWFHLSICYALLLRFRESYDYLSKIDKVDFGLFTLKKDTIRKIQSDAKELRHSVEQCEKEYLAWKEEQERKRQLVDSNSGRNGLPWWGTATIIILLAAVIVLLCIIL